MSEHAEGGSYGEPTPRKDETGTNVVKAGSEPAGPAGQFSGQGTMPSTTEQGGRTGSAPVPTEAED